jgi:hypothetical protein
MGVPGMCPYYDPKNKRCGLSGSSHTDSKCSSKDNWKTCANYEAKRKGTNYQNR